jgi:hypothetical protein
MSRWAIVVGLPHGVPAEKRDESGAKSGGAAARQLVGLYSWAFLSPATSIYLSFVLTELCVKRRPAARSEGPKAADLVPFIGRNTRTALFFCACVGMSLANNISARKISRREVGGPAQRLQAGFRQRERVTRGHIPPPPLTSFERFQPESA